MSDTLLRSRSPGAATEHARRTRRRTEEGGGSSAARALEDDLEPHGGDEWLEELRLREGLDGLFDNELLSDVQLVVVHGEQQRRFRCHKVILAAMSTYFRALFAGGMAEATAAEVTLKDIDPACCEHVLRLLYGQSVRITGPSLLTLMHLADFYGVAQLYARTAELLESHVTKESDNCCAKLAEAAALGCVQAQAHCVRVMLADFGAASRQPSFVSLEQRVLADVLERDELVCADEEVALDGLLRWWAAQPPPAAGAPAAIDELLPLVRWPLLRPATLAQWSDADSRPAALRSSLLNELLLEGFRYRAAGEAEREAMRATAPRCRLRRGMLSLAAPLREGTGVALGDVASDPKLQGAGVTTFSFVWNIRHFDDLSCVSMYSPGFAVGGHTWKIYVYPKGNNNGGAHLSVYLDSGITEAHESLHCTFKLAVVNYRREVGGGGGGGGGAGGGGGFGGGSGGGVREWSVVKESEHVFTKKAKDWGFREFMPLKKLEDERAGYLNEGTITIGVQLEQRP